MGFINTLFKASVLSGLCAVTAYAQATLDTFTDPSSKIVFYRASVPSTSAPGGFQLGVALPTGTDPTQEYLGYLVGSRTNGAGWTGISHAGGMTNALLLLAWVNGQSIQTSFRWTSGYVAPDIYTGNATLTQIGHTINDTHFTLTYRCQYCLTWSQDGVSNGQPITAGSLVLGWAQASTNPTPVTASDATIVQHEDFGEYGFAVSSAQQASYSSWVSSIPTGSPTSAPTSGPTSAPTPTSTACAKGSFSTPPTTTYDYIIVGGGAGGIPLADRLSEAGNSVLLIERGPPSSGRWGGTLKPNWLKNTNLTRFDVPGLDNEIWVDSAGIACPDTGEMAGCVLGGGTAINAGLWWHAPDVDWDYNFPTGWKSTDLASSVSKVFSRIPGTYSPSMDRIQYLDQGFSVVGGALSKAGYQFIEANASPQQRNRTYTRPVFMYSNAERGGPLATYLVTANARKNFKMIMNTSVKRVVRSGAHVTGVEVENFNGGAGYCGTFNVTAKTGRVILSAGALGTPKILMRSGIGPADQLAVVKSSADGPTMIDSKQWLNLPVGLNLDDHMNTDIQITHPNIVFYDYYAAYNTPIAADQNSYLQKRTGPLAQSAPNIAPVFWDQVKGTDGITRQLQYTARVEGDTNKSMTISQYLGRGAVSRGQVTISKNLNMVVSTVPYLRNAQDKAAVVTSIQNLITALKAYSGVNVTVPAADTTVQAYVDSLPVDSSRTANHWLGSAKIGTDSGLKSGGTSVVDLNTQVYGTDNLFVVDASIFPGMPSCNPSALIVAAAEHASDLIQKVPKGTTNSAASSRIKRGQM
ncbi:MAG: hypothetical protein M1820_004657 [Bogoriella megaspora]|nr:MAG: hypothetical protein M1820_004657 [Bogoriella megaspora]